MHKKHKKQVCRFFRPEYLRKVGFRAVFYHSAERRIGRYHIYPILWSVFPKRAGKHIVSFYLLGRFHAVQNHIGDGEQMRKRLQLHSADAGLKQFFIFGGFYFSFVSYVLQRAHKKASRAAGRVQNNFSQLGIGHLHHKFSNRSWRVILPRVSGALQFFKQVFVNLIEMMLVFLPVEIYLVYLVYHLPYQRARLHIVVSVFKNFFDDKAARVVASAESKPFELFEKFVVYEIKEFVSRHTLLVLSPISPAQFRRQRRFVFAVKNFEKQKPDELREPLSVAVNASVFSHNILN